MKRQINRHQSLSWVLIAFVGSYDGSKVKKDWGMGTLRGIKINPR